MSVCNQKTNNEKTLTKAERVTIIIIILIIVIIGVVYLEEINNKFSKMN